MRLSFRIAIPFLFLCLPLVSQAQGFKLGAMGGTTAYLGDLQNDIWHQASWHPAIGIMGAWYYQDWIGLRAHFVMGHINGNDAMSPELAKRQRNLHFRSDIYEIALLAEVDLTGWMRQSIIHPYLAAGIAGFRFNPQARYQGTWYDLQPLGTEGQGTSYFPNRTPYALYELAFPLGGGLRFDLGQHWQLGVEVMYRKTFTDYLDDVSMTYPDLAVLAAENGSLAAALSYRTPELYPDAPNQAAGSQRGNALANDSYMTGTIVLIKRFGANVKQGGYRYQYGCPGKF